MGGLPILHSTEKAVSDLVSASGASCGRMSNFRTTKDMTATETVDLDPAKLAIVF